MANQKIFRKYAKYRPKGVKQKTELLYYQGIRFLCGGRWRNVYSYFFKVLYYIFLIHYADFVVFIDRHTSKNEHFVCPKEYLLAKLLMILSNYLLFHLELID